MSTQLLAFSRYWQPTLLEYAAMLITPLETLAYIVAKAREFDAEVPPVDENSGSNPSDDAECDILEDTCDNPTYQELVAAIESLNDTQKIELLALVFLGRGDFLKAEWQDAIRQAAEVGDKNITRYLTETPLLPDYIEEGLSQLGYSLLDYEFGRL
jgi:hypothetical protein